MNKHSGFTLVELTIVVTIMLILASVGLSNYLFSLKKSHDAVRKSDLATISKALQAFANDFGGYPDSDSSGRLVACDYNNTGLVACSWGQPFSAYKGGKAQTYLGKMPADPDSSRSYFYEADLDAGTFNLYAALENTSDQYITTGLTTVCGTGFTCNYQVTESGVK
jgi:prepilin-type N-terminal cleavage/methylation domain-containing protein